LAQAGEAVSDGFFAAYYQHLGAPNLQRVRLYDSSQDASAAYQQAIADGAEFIIGPLDKDGVNSIAQQRQLSVPLLSLTYPDQPPLTRLANFYQFGLAVEDEARQAARAGIKLGYRRACAITTAQEVSERTAQAFASEWQKLGGTLLSKHVFTQQDTFSQSLHQLMQLDQSQARATQLQQQLSSKLEFTPRRRADVDMIFMAVSPAQGRQILPTLAFQYASNIPVYATSSIYSGDLDASNNDDLNGVLFNSLPWIFDTANPVKQTIAENTKSSAIYGRLHALGADALMLYSRLPELQSAPQMRIYGATGALQLMPDGRIEREQLWARFNHGIAEPLPKLAQSGPQASPE
jgi:outer membrane PBP1 activator LpoA protein